MGGSAGSPAARTMLGHRPEAIARNQLSSCLETALLLRDVYEGVTRVTAVWAGRERLLKGHRDVRGVAAGSDVFSRDRALLARVRHSQLPFTPRPFG